ncbi:hypothetical protein DH2020_031247 [Rehmannia glutinosa]|uniref:Transmembrane protein n=1 Tax=Rehmannia glutinosa TaxID=99300 RepID=A0ABR0VIJ3_REHGL
MSLALQPIFTNKNPTSSPVSFSPINFLKPLNLTISPPNSRTHFTSYRFLTSQSHFFPVRKINASFDESYSASQSQVNGSSKKILNGFNFDAFLSILEFLSLASAAAISVYVALKNGVVSGSKILVWQCVALVSCVLVGAVIRRRQWRRICGARFSRGPSGSYGVNLLGRVEKLEEDLRSSATIIRVLSRQLEKLGIRVRVTRKALKEPISETGILSLELRSLWWNEIQTEIVENTAALAQKNSEVTRALAAQEDILEKELGEIQKVLLAMQEQQQKQLELILAIGKSAKLWETKRVPTKDQNARLLNHRSMEYQIWK